MSGERILLIHPGQTDNEDILGVQTRATTASPQVGFDINTFEALLYPGRQWCRERWERSSVGDGASVKAGWTNGLCKFRGRHRAQYSAIEISGPGSLRRGRIIVGSAVVVLPSSSVVMIPSTVISTTVISSAWPRAKLPGMETGNLKRSL